MVNGEKSRAQYTKRQMKQQQHQQWHHFESFFFTFSDRYEYTKKMGTEGNLEKSYFKKWPFLSCCRQQKHLSDTENEQERGTK